MELKNIKIAGVDISAIINQFINFVLTIWKNFLPEEIADKIF